MNLDKMVDDDEYLEYEYSRYVVICKSNNMEPLDIDAWYKGAIKGGRMEEPTSYNKPMESN